MRPMQRAVLGGRPGRPGGLRWRSPGGDRRRGRPHRGHQPRTGRADRHTAAHRRSGGGPDARDRRAGDARRRAPSAASVVPAPVVPAVTEPPTTPAPPVIDPLPGVDQIATVQAATQQVADLEHPLGHGLEPGRRLAVRRRAGRRDLALRRDGDATGRARPGRAGDPIRPGLRTRPARDGLRARRADVPRSHRPRRRHQRRVDGDERDHSRSGHRVAGAVRRATRGRPQRRQPRLRPRRQPLRRDGGRRGEQRPRRPGPVQAPRHASCASARRRTAPGTTSRPTTRSSATR